MAKRTNKTVGFVAKIFRFVIGVILAVFTVFFLYNSTINLLRRSYLFTIKEVVRSPALSMISSRYLEPYLGRNLFEVDLVRIHRQLQSKYPYVNQLRVVREFPGRIYIVANVRDPFARTTISGKPVIFDKEGTAIPSDDSAGNLPEILGLGDNKRYAWGQHFYSDKVKVALDIIKEIRGNKYLDAYNIKAVDMQHLSKIEIHLDSSALPLGPDPFYVLMDPARISQKVRTLGILLSQGNLNPGEIKYIDLRFKEPILAKQEKAGLLE